MLYPKKRNTIFLTALLILVSHLFSAGTPKADGNDQIWNLVGG